MGSCLSKKKGNASVSTTVAVDPNNPKCDNNTSPKVESESKMKNMVQEIKPQEEDQGLVKKEIFVIKHRRSHDRERDRSNGAVDVVVVENGVASSSSSAEEIENNNNNNNTNNMVRTSSCTKEEVDAILIQCGRLSRSNSSGKAYSSGRKYSGSKRSYDFDHHDRENGHDDDDEGNHYKKGNDSYCGDDDEAAERLQHRHRHRQPGRSSSHGRRRTPSRERDQQQQQRSGSRERGSSGSGRRVSRSPGRRSETTTATTTNNSTNVSNRPGKMVSVPATVSSLVMDKSNDNGGGIKRISVKRNVASPRSQSPARMNANAKGCNENQQQQPSLSRSSSRKAEQSPYRRNPLNEIDPNSLAYLQSATNSRVHHKNREEIDGEGAVVNQASTRKPNLEMNSDRVVQGTNCKPNSRGALNNKAVSEKCPAKEQQQIVEEAKTQTPISSNVTVTTVVASGAESLNPQKLTRSRSSRRSRDLDLNPETLLNPKPSYTTLLLEDIQNFHQKNNTPTFSLPPCVTKACSIVEAVADLNSTTGSNLSCAFSDDRKSPPTDQSNKNCYNHSSGGNLVAKKSSEAKDPFVESEVLADDDLMEPSFHKYVTVRRGGTLDEAVDMEEQESSGSNSFVGGGQQHWGHSSSSWEPNSADSTDCWTSRSNTREEDPSLPGFQRHALSESGRDVIEARRGFSGKKRDSDYQQQTRIGRGRVGGKGLQTISIVAATASM